MKNEENFKEKTILRACILFVCNLEIMLVSLTCKSSRYMRNYIIHYTVMFFQERKKINKYNMFKVILKRNFNQKLYLNFVQFIISRLIKWRKFLYNVEVRFGSDVIKNRLVEMLNL